MTTNRKVPAAVIALLVFIVLGALHIFDVFDYLEYKAYDFRVKLFADTYKPSDDIVVILLDQHSIDWANQEKGWGWPWPRMAYADIVNFMNAGGAKSVAFDVLFTEPSIYRSANQDEIIDTAVQRMEELRQRFAGAGAGENPPGRRGGGTGLRGGGTGVRGEGGERGEGRDDGPGEEQRRLFENYASAMTALRGLSDRADDNALVKAAEEYGRVVMTVFFSTQTGNAAAWPADLQKPLLIPRDFDSAASAYNLPGEGRAQFPIPGLAAAAGALGNVTNAADFDGINRRARLFVNFDGKAVPGLSAASLLASGAPEEIRYNEKKRQIEWDTPDGESYVIPVDHNGKSILRFRGSLNRYIPYSAADILQSMEALSEGGEGLYRPEEFRDKYVFFGFYAPGLFDICSNPLESVYPGMGIHITMLDNMLSGDFIREAPLWADWAVLLAAILLTTALVLFCSSLRFSIGGSIVIAVVLAAAALAAYHVFCLWFPLVLPLAGVLVSFLTGTIYNYATEGSQKRFIKSAFSQYLSPTVIEQIIADPSNLELGGKSLEMSAIFTDIQKFSSISEGLQKAYGKEGPKELVNLLNLYLTEMSNIVLANQGTIDKFEGDAIIAFFGAPVPTERHAALACRASVQMKKAEGTMMDQIMDTSGRFYPVLHDLIEKGVIRSERPLYTRIGINSGEMVVGNMGTQRKMNYTIMGNAVNLAARLEGVNKQYDTGGILLSEYTKEKIDDSEFVLRPLSRVRVVGISTPVRLYELLDLREDAPAELSAAVKTWETIFAAYEGRDFKRALEGFAGICQRDPGDLAARLYLKRCEKYLVSPPADTEWDDGVDNLSSK